MNTKRKIFFYFAPLLMVTSFSAVNAGTLAVVFDPGTLQNTTALTGFATNGAMMDGMDVGVSFGDGSSSSYAWADTGAISGGVSWSGGGLSLSGDSFSNTWALSDRGAFGGISSILLDAAVGNSLFDTTFGGSQGTAGSASGKTFQIAGINNFDIVATYIDEIGVAGNAAVGDLYRYLKIDFGKQSFGGILNFYQDTDNLDFSGEVPVVPVPAAAWLFGSALLGFFGFSRRKATV